MKKESQESSLKCEREPYLLTPGPLTTDVSVRSAMMRDWGSWDVGFQRLTKHIRSSVLKILGSSEKNYECIPMQGSGSFAVESMLGTFAPSNNKTLILANGAYGLRAARTMDYMKRPYRLLDKGDYLPPSAEEVESILKSDGTISHVFLVHCETSSGILNPLKEVATVTSELGRHLLIDSMSAFGALEIDPIEVDFDVLVSSANKCIEGVPGFSFAIAKKESLLASKGNSHSLCLDLYDQWEYMEKTGQWRFTPPTHVVAAFNEALKLHFSQGGSAGRLQRYTQNKNILVSGMRNLGFETLLSDPWLSPIIVTFFYPSDKAFKFPFFYDLMKEKGFVIYPGKLTVADSFRIGCIGSFSSDVMEKAVKAVAESLNQMGVKSARPAETALQEKNKLQ
ncbi:MAG: 2-aminoethylphosphonate--pyruvate transaminase [Pseudomonadota bacterium]|nr:2-aminoethylphosphonate--pyruvate transaminase [Pseudomonadota bacterium]